MSDGYDVGRVGLYVFIGFIATGLVWNFSDEHNLANGLISFFDTWEEATYDQFLANINPWIYRVETLDPVYLSLWYEEEVPYCQPISLAILHVVSWEVTYHIGHFFYELLTYNHKLDVYVNFFFSILVGFIIFFIFALRASSRSASY